MRVEIKIDSELAQPYAILHIPKLTTKVGALVELLESAEVSPRLLPAKRGDKSYVIAAENMELIRTESGSVMLYDRQAQGFTVDKPLHEILGRLGHDFVRISKSAIVNINRIDHVSPSFNGTMDIIMKNGMTDYISRKFLGEFKKRLGL